MGNILRSIEMSKIIIAISGVVFLGCVLYAWAMVCSLSALFGDWREGHSYE